MATHSKRLKTAHTPSMKTDPEDYNCPFPYFMKPREVGHFRQDLSHKFVEEKTKSVKYLYKRPSNVELNLRSGIDTFIKRDETVKDNLDDMLRWILLNLSQFELQKIPSQSNTQGKTFNLFTDFICWRGLLTKILCTPYENRDGWEMAVIKFHNTLYMCEYDTEEKKASRETETEQQKMFVYGGYKFEQYMTIDSPDGTPDLSRPVNNNEGFCSVVRTRLEKHSLVYSGEVDCCESRDSSAYVELKTSREIEKANQLRNFKRFKLIKWWCQCFLLNISKVICGFRDDDCVVRRLETFETMKIPNYCKDIYNPWQGHVCFNFLNQFLSFVKKTVTEDDPRIAYVFKWHPREDIIVSRSHDAKYQFIPQWYIDNWHP